MTAVFVNAYAAAAGREEHEAALNLRDRVLAARLEALGTPVIGLGCTRSRSEVQTLADEGLAWRWLPVDDETVGLRQDMTSSALVAAVAELRPSLLLLKGVGTGLSAAVMQAAAARTVVGVIGGRFRYPAYRGLHVALTEDEEQDRYLGRRLGAAQCLRLPKLVHPVFRDQRRHAAQTYDVVCVGALIPLKNHLALLGLREHDLRVAVVGDGPERPRLEAELSGGRAIVHFLGDLDRADVADVVRSSRLLLHPSLSEGFPRAVAEAMYAGLPVVAVAGVVGAPVQHGVNGLLVEADEVAGAAVELLRDERRRARLGRAAAETAREHFSPQRLDEAARDLQCAVEQLDTLSTRAVRARRQGDAALHALRRAARGLRPVRPPATPGTGRRGVAR